jgi:hypothetical protein
VVDGRCFSPAPTLAFRVGLGWTSDGTEEEEASNVRCLCELREWPSWSVSVAQPLVISCLDLVGGKDPGQFSGPFSKLIAIGQS